MKCITKASSHYALEYYIGTLVINAYLLMNVFGMNKDMTTLLGNSPSKKHIAVGNTHEMQISTNENMCRKSKEIKIT